MKIIIIGNGILALTTAFRLLDKINANDEIVIVGKSERKGSATMVAPAMLNSFAELETDSLLSEFGRYKFQLSMEATKAWPAFLQKIVNAANACTNANVISFNGAQERDWFDVGTYVINNAAADELDDENFDAIVRALKEYDEPYQWVNVNEIPNYAPNPRSRAARAIYLDNEGWFNPRLIVALLEDIFKHHPQVTLLDKYVTDIQQQGNEISYIHTDDNEKIAGDKFLLAAGAATVDLLTKSQLPLATQRVFYGIGVTLQLHSPQHPHQKCIRTPNRGLACGLYSTPYFQGSQADNNHIAIGATNFVSPTPCRFGRLTSVTTLMNGAIDQLNANFYKAELVSVNVGERPLSQDGYPLIGGTSIKNLFIATGTRREGIHLAPVISEKLSALMLDEAVDVKFNIFHPERELISELSREEAIKKAIKHQVSAIYQHGFNATDLSMIRKLKEKFADDLHAVHDQIGAFDWGIPADMVDMYRYGHALPPKSVISNVVKCA